MKRRALVTGASSGIGEACAKLLARSGYRVALLARRSERLERLRDELPGQGHLAIACDLRDSVQIEAAFALLDEQFGGLELLVNNAGIGYRARVEELEVEALRELLEVNVGAVLLSCRSALPLLRRGQRPVVVNVSSVVGLRGIPGQVAYAASKAAVGSIGEGLRVEWATESIAVCTLEPGLTATEIFEAQENPAGLPRPDLARADSAERVARELLRLDRAPRPQLTLRWNWRAMGILTRIAPRVADRIVARKLR